MRLLLDTHVWIWLLDDPDRLSPPAAAAINAGGVGACGVSDISAWEVARKESLGKLSLAMACRAWLCRAAAAPGIMMLRVDPEVAWESCHLPGAFHRDPADRIIVATARLRGLRLVTCDRKLLDYPHVETIW